ncbi:MAG: NAD-binding protein, partial [Phaeodactylibacter sp.]|nr:NAD-binding protein [Phaeodactylibacter sp.]
MKIVIAGAGDIGFHLAELLSFEKQDIVLIDTNQEVLDYAATHLDVMTLRGDASSIDVLRQADVARARLVLAVTTSEKTNLVTAILAKKMGAHQTIARVSNQEYLEDSQRETFKELGVDSLISPVLLAGEEIRRLIRECSFTDHFAFEDGKINLIGVTLDEYSPLVNQEISNIDKQGTDLNLRPIAILRGHRTIIPRGKTILRRGDHVYFITKKKNMEKLNNLIGKQKYKVKNIMILGGTPLGLASAKQLEKDYNVTVIERNKERCKVLAEQLHNSLIINGDASNIDLLEEEGL